MAILPFHKLMYHPTDGPFDKNSEIKAQPRSNMPVARLSLNHSLKGEEK
jgi:hypothetical protein